MRWGCTLFILGLIFSVLSTEPVKLIRKSLLYPRKRRLEVYGNYPICRFVRPSVCLSRVNLTFALTFEPKEIGLYICVFLVARLFCYYQTIWPWDLDLDFLPTFEKPNLGHNFWTKIDRAFILHTCISCGKTFLLKPEIVTLWQSTLTFDLLLKKLNFALTFEPKEIGLSYLAWIFLVARPFCLYQYFDQMTLTFNLLYKNLTLALTFEPKRFQKLGRGISAVRTAPF